MSGDSDFWSAAFNWLTTDEDDEEEGSSIAKESYLSLWRRMNLVVKVLAREKRKEDATHCVFAFFKHFEDLGELEEAVNTAEQMLTEETPEKADESSNSHPHRPEHHHRPMAEPEILKDS